MRSAPTIASTQKRQVSVLKSKYFMYSLSGGTIKEVIAAAAKAASITGFPFMNRQRAETAFLTNDILRFPPFLPKSIIHLGEGFVKGKMFFIFVYNLFII